MAKLYYFETLNPRKVCATAKLLGSPVDYVRLDLAKGEHKSAASLARNPNGKVPVLVDGDFKLWESLAIMVWLAGEARSELWPSNPSGQAEVLRWASWDAFHFLPKAGAFYFEHHIKPMFRLGPPDEAALAAATPAFHTAAKALDAQLADHAFVTGSKLTIADFCVGATLPLADEIHLPLADYGHIRRWHDKLMDLPAWRDPWPSRSTG
jgi:glutathione S-transferase